MGKIRTKIIGLEDVEKQQKEEAKKRKEVKNKKATQKKENTEKDSSPPIGGSVEMTGDREKKETKKSTKKASELKLHVRGKKHIKAKKELKDKEIKKAGVDIDAGLALLKKVKYADFDETVEVHINVDETGLKGEADMPHSTGKKIRVKVVDDKLIEDIAKNKIDFDVLIAHPSFMPKLARYAKVLGPRGLMPNPKAGTISTNPEETVKKFEKGLLRWKTEPKAPLIHQAVGKASFEDKALKENIISLLKSVGRSHIQGAFLKTTMSPSVKLNLKEF